jgi:hypothetical protein
MVNKSLGAHRTEELALGVLVELGAGRYMPRLVIGTLLFLLMGVTEVVAVEEIKKTI